MALILTFPPTRLAQPPPYARLRSPAHRAYASRRRSPPNGVFIQDTNTARTHYVAGPRTLAIGIVSTRRDPDLTVVEALGAK